ncbi:MAG: HU family DNA-binding protein [Deltaproteobacteria bacterium]|nr:HU family DNA-binding protein [Deltaproteobacteria bacterium]
MTKAELIGVIAKDADISKAAAAKALEAYVKTVATELKKNGKLGLVGFGTFSVIKRKARTGRNPQTGDKIKIKAKKVVKFKPGKGLTDKVK